MSYANACSDNDQIVVSDVVDSGETIGGLIDASGKTQTEIARECERNRSAVSRWKSDNAVAEDCYECFAEAVGVPVSRVREISEAGRPDRSDEPDTVERKYEWKGLVQRSRLSLVAKAILYALLDKRHPTTGVSAESDEEIAEHAGLDPKEVAACWGEVVASPFVERIGTNRFTLRPKFPQ